MHNIDRKQIQGLLRTSYPRSAYAAYHLLEIRDGAGAKRWLAAIRDKLSYAAGREDEGTHLNIALSAAALGLLGLKPDALETFPAAFRQGMAEAHRARILGDIGENAPERWSWGGPKNAEAHVLLLAFARSAEELASLLAPVEAAMGGALVPLLGSPLRAAEFNGENNFEHFGFRDGISQPLIQGLHGRADSAANEDGYSHIVPAGEFVLGYESEREQRPSSPSVADADDPSGLLPQPSARLRGRRDFGRDGSFLVLRQLAQDVAAFWNYAHGASPAGTPQDALACEPLAAKLVGRWRNGSPLVEAWKEPDASKQFDNAFAYRDVDAAGLRCPMGAHIRRAVPRDALGVDANTGIDTARLHRLIRRGRGYGPRLPDERKFSGDDAERGLYFICLNASIERQFEFVQQSWINGTKLAGLYDEQDPIAANPMGGGRFSIPGAPVRKVLRELPRFVTVKGGGYFFLPGRAAIEFLSA